MKSKPVCETLLPWLKNNLGKACLGVLTGTDIKALSAAIHIVELYAYAPADDVAIAFGLSVGKMQQSARYLAYHAIAHVLDWDDRQRLWSKTGLPPLGNPGRCNYEPGGALR